jgi:hypothetical protein
MILRKLIRKIISMIKSIPFHMMRYRLKWIYQNQSRQPTKGNSNPEAADPEVIALGKRLRDESLNAYQKKYQHKPYRFLFNLPASGVGKVWFSDLMQTLEHTGIKCCAVHSGDPAFRQIWEKFQPNVFISIDVPNILKNSDLDFIQDYKKANGCFRLYTPYPKYKFPEPGISPEDIWRLDLARSGKSADAYFCMYVKEYFPMYLAEWVAAGFQYLELPHGCNPLNQYPREGEKEFDYFIATSYGPVRVEMTWHYMKSIFKKYHGLWAGDGWGFGLGALESEKLPAYYARTKIVPNPMAPFLIHNPMEISERAFSSLACGAFQITDWTPITDRYFSSDELVQVHGKDEFIRMFEYYVNHPYERNEIVKNGMKRLYAEHTYFHRIDRLIDFLDNNAKMF